MESNNVNTEPIRCTTCQAIISPSDLFCGNCGEDLTKTEVEEEQNVFTELQPTLLYYFSTLVLLATYKFTNVFPDGLEGNILVTGIDVIIVIAFWILYFDKIGALFSLKGFRLRIAAIVILASALGSFIVSKIADFISLSIYDDVFYSTAIFQETTYPILFATLLIAVQPAIFEEVAFRGFIYENLKKITGKISPIYITSFIFGMIHLQIISLIWLIPLGLGLGFLRYKYNTLWYGVIAHFTYNFSITIGEFYGWF